MTSNDILRAKKGHRIMNIDKIDAITKISEVISGCHLIKGTRYIAEDGVIMSGLVYERIMSVCPRLTIEELRLACTEAMYSDKDCYISPKDIMKWIKDYISSDEYESAKMQARTIEASRQLAAPSKDSSRREEIEVVKQTLRKDYMAYSQTKSFPVNRFASFRGKQCHDYLVSINEIKDGEWKSFLDKAKMSDNLFMGAIEVPKDILAKALCVDNYLINLYNRKNG